MDGDLTSRAELLRDLNGRKCLNKLSFNEREMLDKVMKYFINEWLITDKSLTRSIANKEINKALQKSINKVKDPEEE
jgi:DNA phosphorothioation-dependent restriction protein DptG